MKRTRSSRLSSPVLSSGGANGTAEIIVQQQRPLMVVKIPTRVESRCKIPRLDFVPSGCTNDNGDGVDEDNNDEEDPTTGLNSSSDESDNDDNGQQSYNTINVHIVYRENGNDGGNDDGDNHPRTNASAMINDEIDESSNHNSGASSTRDEAFDRATRNQSDDDNDVDGDDVDDVDDNSNHTFRTVSIDDDESSNHTFDAAMVDDENANHVFQVSGSVHNDQSRSLRGEEGRFPLPTPPPQQNYANRGTYHHNIQQHHQSAWLQTHLRQNQYPPPMGSSLANSTRSDLPLEAQTLSSQPLSLSSSSSSSSLSRTQSYRSSTGGETMALGSPLAVCEADLYGTMYSPTDEYFFCERCNELFGYYPDSNGDTKAFHRIVTAILNHRIRSPGCVRTRYFDNSVVERGPLDNPTLNGLRRVYSFDDCFNRLAVRELASMGLYQWGTELHCAYCAFTVPVSNLIDQTLRYVIRRHTTYGDNPVKRCSVPIQCEINDHMVVRPAGRLHEKCCICLTNRNNLLLQCNHLVCEPCGLKIRSCPVCRVRIEPTWSRTLYVV